MCTAFYPSTRLTDIYKYPLSQLEAENVAADKTSPALALLAPTLQGTQRRASWGWALPVLPNTIAVGIFKFKLIEIK